MLRRVTSLHGLMKDGGHSTDSSATVGRKLGCFQMLVCLLGSRGWQVWQAAVAKRLYLSTHAGARVSRALLTPVYLCSKPNIYCSPFKVFMEHLNKQVF